MIFLSRDLLRERFVVVLTPSYRNSSYVGLWAEIKSLLDSGGGEKEGGGGDNEKNNKNNEKKNNTRVAPPLLPPPSPFLSLSSSPPLVNPASPFSNAASRSSCVSLTRCCPNELERQLGADTVQNLLHSRKPPSPTVQAIALNHRLDPEIWRQHPQVQHWLDFFRHFSLAPERKEEKRDEKKEEKKEEKEKKSYSALTGTLLAENDDAALYRSLMEPPVQLRFQSETEAKADTFTPISSFSSSASAQPKGVQVQQAKKVHNLSLMPMLLRNHRDAGIALVWCLERARFDEQQLQLYCEYEQSHLRRADVVILIAEPTPELLLSYRVYKLWFSAVPTHELYVRQMEQMLAEHYERTQLFLVDLAGYRAQQGAGRAFRDLFSFVHPLLLSDAVLLV
jgi:hypothetical protein